MTNSDYANASPADVRGLIRDGSWTGTTTGASTGYLQANLAILPSTLADDFQHACELNPQALPLLERTRPGDPTPTRTAAGADLTTDLPRYHVHRHGVVDSELTELGSVWREDLVAFLLGCSFSAEEALLDASVRLRHLEEGRGVPMFSTNIPCAPAGAFGGPTVVSMRPVRTTEIDLATRATEKLPLAHGGPLHIGSPEQIGIHDLNTPDWGEAIDIRADETPVFWACGVTPQNLIRSAKPEFAITHAPGHMFVTDVAMSDLVGRHELP